ncbi:MAG TPA: hypothetical protein VM487_14945 [Phycisphaerae bacterium]|nr:hypothetical protein [Phycisphaerae bacterium]
MTRNMADLTRWGQVWLSGIPREFSCLAILPPGLLRVGITAYTAGHYGPSRAAQESLDQHTCYELGCFRFHQIIDRAPTNAEAAVVDLGEWLSRATAHPIHMPLKDAEATLISYLAHKDVDIDTHAPKRRSEMADQQNGLGPEQSCAALDEGR